MNSAVPNLQLLTGNDRSLGTTVDWERPLTGPVAVQGMPGVDILDFVARLQPLHHGLQVRVALLQSQHHIHSTEAGGLLKLPSTRKCLGVSSIKDAVRMFVKL